MTIIPLPAFSDNYIWSIINENQHTLTCVDPGSAAPVLSYAERNGLTLTNILLTHHHVDHTGGVFELLQQFPEARVYGPADDRILDVQVAVRDEDIIHIDNLAFRVLSTPGHTCTHICYQEPTKGWLFCGDTLFSAGCGRVFDSTIEALYASIFLLKHLPEDTKVFCGHEYTLNNLRFASTVEPENKLIHSYIHYLQDNQGPCSLPSSIALEKKINPFMRTHLPSLQHYASTHGLPTHDALAIFKLIRENKDIF